MRKGVLAGALVSILAAGSCFLPVQTPKRPPEQRAPVQHVQKVQTVIYYDEEMKEYHGEKLETVVDDIVENHNTRRRAWLNEELHVEEIRPLPSKDSKSTGVYFLNSLILQSDAKRMNIYFMGQQTYFYNRGSRIAFGGIAQYRGNSAIIWGARPVDAISQTFDHEVFHNEGAYDLELPGADSMYNVAKSKLTYDIDVGNLHLIKTIPRTAESTQESQRLFKARINHASGFFANSEEISPYIENLILEEHTVTSEEYQQALQDLLRHGEEKTRGEFIKWMAQLERYPRPPALKENAAAGEKYWAANAAYWRGDHHQAYELIGEAMSAYKGTDARIITVMDAADAAIREKLLGSTAQILGY
jgi:hypothetical protein